MPIGKKMQIYIYIYIYTRYVYECSVVVCVCVCVFICNGGVFSSLMFIVKTHRNRSIELVNRAIHLRISIAAIQVNLRPMTASGFMVSNVDVQRGEGWYWIDQEKFDGNGKGLADKLNKPDYSDVCPPKQQQGQQQGQGQQLQRHQDTLPFVLHYCQRYGEELKGAYYFSKYEMRPKFLSCGVELLQEPTVDDIAGPQTDVSLVDSLIAKRNAKKNATDGGGSDSDTSGLSELKRLMFRPRNRHRDAWVLCTLIPAINEAAVFFKTRHCPTDPGSSTNFNKSRVFPEKVVNRHNWA